MTARYNLYVVRRVETENGGVGERKEEVEEEEEVEK